VLRKGILCALIAPSSSIGTANLPSALHRALDQVARHIVCGKPPSHGVQTALQVRHLSAHQRIEQRFPYRWRRPRADAINRATHDVEHGPLSTATCAPRVLLRASTYWLALPSRHAPCQGCRSSPLGPSAIQGPSSCLHLLAASASTNPCVTITPGPSLPKMSQPESSQ
jgi:hypothetical protein